MARGPFSPTPQPGLSIQLYLILAPAAEHGGSFYGPNQLNLWNTAERAPTNPTAHNDKDCARLYNETRRILEERVGQPVPAAS